MREQRQLGRRAVLGAWSAIGLTTLVGCAGSSPVAAARVPPRSPDGAAPRPERVLEPVPVVEPEPVAQAAPLPVVPSLKLPPRVPGAKSGSAFLESARGLGRQGLDDAVLREVRAGNVPDFQRRFVPIELSGASGLKARLFVLCDYLAIGSDQDFVRMPMTSAAAQTIADLTHTSLPTRRLVDEIYRQAGAKLPPSYIDGGPTDDEIDDFGLHHEKLEARRKQRGFALGVLTAGNKKDIVLSNRLAEKVDRVAIYGWHKAEGEIIQPLSTTHSTRYADYSHGVRLVHRQVWIDEQEHDLLAMLSDDGLCSLVSDEGPLSVLAYDKVLPEYHGPPKKKRKKAR